MPIQLDIKRKLFSKSDRVKFVDIHPTEPWVLSCLYNGKVQIIDYENQKVIKTFEVSNVAIRTGAFIARKQWFVCGADDFHLHVYNYNTMERVKLIDAHKDYIRNVAVHPSMPYILSSSDDLSIKLWDWDKNFANTRIYEGHKHFVMTVCFNPKDSNAFASCSLDKTIKIWGLNTSQPHFTLQGHNAGVNCVNFYHGNDKPYLISSADDKTARVWDYQTKACITTLDLHEHNVSVACFHPHMPIILTGAEDGKLRVWNAITYGLESELDYKLGRVWSISCSKTTNKVAIGYDEGTVVLKLGKEEPVISMDNNGKVVFAVNSEIQQMNVKSGASDAADGEKLALPSRDLGTCDIYPHSLKHDHKGRFVAVCGDGEYNIYTAIQWRSKSFGKAQELVWGLGSGTFATRESSTLIKLYKDFQEQEAFKPSFGIEGIFGGHLLGVKSFDFITFYLWEDLTPIRTIEVAPRQVFWSDSGDYVTFVCENSFYVLRYNSNLVNDALDSGEEIPEDGIEGSFELLHEITERVRDGQWVGDSFLYTNKSNKLSYYIADETPEDDVQREHTFTLAHLDRPLYLLGFVPKESRVYLVDKHCNVVSYQLKQSVLEYQSAIIRGDYNKANKFLPKVPEEFYDRLARFLDNRGLKEQALEVTKDEEHRFELALELGQLDRAKEMLGDMQDSEYKWKELGSVAMSQGNIDLAEQCMRKGEDYPGLLLLYSSLGDSDKIQQLAQDASASDKNNVAFMCKYLLGDIQGCIDLLTQTDRLPEAALMARTYAPSKVTDVLNLWKDDLKKVNEKAAEALADPFEYPNLFPGFDAAVKAEESRQSTLLPGSQYLDVKSSLGKTLTQDSVAEETAEDQEDM
eukprot:gb/GECH01013348.1/.p1 GENE.gb/GECH01013348.1/~~gb/GECH01013348.1/.p1  ORF type:complete len:859 (+),score=194.26 gb/GECH01013348.1/:1-2577(+)